jgi:phytanoyl-CoA hydroxylase
MHYPLPTDQDIRRFESDGFLVVKNVIDPEEGQAFLHMAQQLAVGPPDGANDWDWRRGEALDKRVYRIVQSGVDRFYPWVTQSRFRSWAAAFGAALMRQEMEFWYEQFLGKPPGIGAATPWHQDEAYWGRTLADRGVTCWTAFHQVGPENGCMHFVRGGQRRLLEHRNPPEMASDLLVCDIDAGAEVVPCPIEAGDVTFHHSRMPHMTTANSSERWRLVLTQHFRNPQSKQLPEHHYPWRVQVSQRSGSRVQQTAQGQGSEERADDQGN